MLGAPRRALHLALLSRTPCSLIQPAGFLLVLGGSLRERQGTSAAALLRRSYQPCVSSGAQVSKAHPACESQELVLLASLKSSSCSQKIFRKFGCRGKIRGKSSPVARKLVFRGSLLAQVLILVLIFHWITGIHGFGLVTKLKRRVSRNTAAAPRMKSVAPANNAPDYVR